MNVAAITITYNDDYKFTEWLGHYQEYKDELYLHIVVDNHSCEEYASKLRTFFLALRLSGVALTEAVRMHIMMG